MLKQGMPLKFIIRSEKGMLKHGMPLKFIISFLIELSCITISLRLEKPCQIISAFTNYKQKNIVRYNSSIP
jgi:hypothetical protein